ncbi:MAG: hypothetical protein AAGD32_09285 [Planctomycetota bacterium]
MLAEAGMPNFIDQNTAVAIVGVGAAVFGYLYLRGAAKRKPKRSDPLDDLAGKKSLAQQRNLERDMQQLLLELTDMTRQMNAQIDTKAAKLETLIQDAEQAEQRLRAALGESGQIDTPVQPLTADQFPEPRRQATAANGATNGDRTAMNNIELPDAKSPLARHDEVYRLADEGVSVDDIAQRTSRPRGEIDLILALRRT